VVDISKPLKDFFDVQAARSEGPRPILHHALPTHLSSEGPDIMWKRSVTPTRARSLKKILGARSSRRHSSVRSANNSKVEKAKRTRTSTEANKPASSHALERSRVTKEEPQEARQPEEEPSSWFCGAREAVVGSIEKHECYFNCLGCGCLQQIQSIKPSRMLLQDIPSTVIIPLNEHSDSSLIHSTSNLSRSGSKRGLSRLRPRILKMRSSRSLRSTASCDSSKTLKMKEAAVLNSERSLSRLRSSILRSESSRSLQREDSSASLKSLESKGTAEGHTDRSLASSISRISCGSGLPADDQEQLLDEYSIGGSRSSRGSKLKLKHSRCKLAGKGSANEPYYLVLEKNDQVMGAGISRCLGFVKELRWCHKHK